MHWRQLLDQYRPADSRNFIKVGDVVSWKPGEHKNPMEVKVLKIVADAEGEVEWLDVVVCRSKVNGTSQAHAGKYRSISPNQVKRLARTRVERARGAC